MLKPKETEKGLVQMIVIIVLTIVILSLLGISLKGLFDKLAANETLGENFSYVWNWLKDFFNKYLGQYFHSFKDFIVNSLKEVLLKVFNKS